MKNGYLPIIIALFASTLAMGQLPKTDALYQTLKEQDSLLFNAAFNTCGIPVLNGIFTEDFEFYHDKGGLTEGKEAFVSRIAEGCAQRAADSPQPAKRILIEDSLEVYPLYKNGELYAAIQHGVHRFEFLNQNNEYQRGDIAKFTHVWVRQDGRWKVRRELSYDHHLQP
ncbi:MAG: nuclear transport factor 2 family protein [Flavobacteriaceae bacterium]|nr:nuclear transport factor 2 family protein [Flavobacteriaceae bacterium]